MIVSTMHNRSTLYMHNEQLKYSANPYFLIIYLIVCLFFNKDFFKKRSRQDHVPYILITLTVMAWRGEKGNKNGLEKSKQHPNKHAICYETQPRLIAQ
jgi:hypothetical protein